MLEIILSVDNHLLYPKGFNSYSSQRSQFILQPSYVVFLLRYTSLPCSVLLKDFPLPPLSLLRKIIEGNSGAVKCAESLNHLG